MIVVVPKLLLLSNRSSRAGCSWGTTGAIFLGIEAGATFSFPFNEITSPDGCAWGLLLMWNYGFIVFVNESYRCRGEVGVQRYTETGHFLQHASNREGPWEVIGDFNEILYQSENIGGDLCPTWKMENF